MRELHCKEECELLMQHAAITSPVILGNVIVYSLFFYVMMPSPLICSKQRPVWIFTLLSLLNNMEAKVATYWVLLV